MKLLPRQDLIKTGPVDEGDWVYRPVVGEIARMRFRMILNLLGDEKLDRVLEIGYGSGVFLPELGKHCRELHGIDVHSMPEAVTQKLAAVKTIAFLKTAGAECLPYPDNYFDAAVAVSSLEFVSDLEAACAEVQRVLKPGGRFIFVTPGTSKVLDLGLKLLTGNDAEKDFAGRRQIVIPTAKKYFHFKRTSTAPPIIGSIVKLYMAVECEGMPETKRKRAS
jgi:ubiquinone/menaquinone biosynthesis C-methylase UbiE